MKALKRAGKAAKTFASIVLAGSLVGIGLVGCSGEAMGNASGRDDEIVLTVSKCQTKELPQELLDEMTNRHPNLRFEFDTYSNSNYSAQIVTELEQRDIPDILINTRNQDLTEDLEHNLVDLAAYDFSSKYLPSVLDRMTIDGSLYYLPGYLTQGSSTTRTFSPSTAGRRLSRSRNSLPSTSRRRRRASGSWRTRWS